MPKLSADKFDVSVTEIFFINHGGFEHLKVRKRGDLIVIESGPDGDRFAHARLRRVTKQWWTLEMPTHAGRWEDVPIRAPRLEVLQLLVDDFAWTLAAVDQL